MYNYHTERNQPVSFCNLFLVENYKIVEKNSCKPSYAKPPMTSGYAKPPMKPSSGYAKPSMKPTEKPVEPSMSPEKPDIMATGSPATNAPLMSSVMPPSKPEGDSIGPNWFSPSIDNEPVISTGYVPIMPPKPEIIIADQSDQNNVLQEILSGLYTDPSLGFNPVGLGPAKPVENFEPVTALPPPEKPVEIYHLQPEEDEKSDSSAVPSIFNWQPIDVGITLDSLG